MNLRALGAAALVAAGAIAVSPWYPVSPFHFAVPVWLAGLVPLLPGRLLVALGPSTWLNMLFLVAGTALSALPWLGLLSLPPTESRRRQLLRLAPVVGLVLVVIFGWATLVELQATGKSFGPSHLAGIASVVLLGGSIAAVGASIVRARLAPKATALGWLCLGSGVSIGLFVALPLGMLGLVAVYAVLGSLLLASGGSKS